MDKLSNDQVTRVFNNREKNTLHIETNTKAICSPQNITQEHMANETTHEPYAKPNTTQEKKQGRRKDRMVRE